MYQKTEVLLSFVGSSGLQADDDQVFQRFPMVGLYCEDVTEQALCLFALPLCNVLLGLSQFLFEL